ncbi:hypothetical protein LCGC14_1935280 [marine sediment metagenome]|uniref:Uncharacterized protein n=1 Tax=marine sediment metagenome TaxID=412755 RepID=A0A0F9FMC4_9ZZZZ
MSLVVNMLLCYFIGLATGFLLGAKAVRVFWLKKYPADDMSLQPFVNRRFEDVLNERREQEVRDNNSTGSSARGTPGSEGGG